MALEPVAAVPEPPTDDSHAGCFNAAASSAAKSADAGQPPSQQPTRAPGSLPGSGDMATTRNGLRPAASQGCQRSHSAAQHSSGDSTSSRTAPAEGSNHAHSALFVRRSPEDYVHIGAIQSSLTALLRQEASWTDGPQHIGAVRKSLELPVDVGKTLAIRVHFPPFDEESVVTVTVPTAMRVVDLADEVLRQHAEVASVIAHAEHELRLYDEDEHEPEYDCPPFDRHLQLGCLNAFDVALCLVRTGGNESASSPSSSRQEVVRSSVEQEQHPLTDGMVEQSEEERQVRAGAGQVQVPPRKGCAEEATNRCSMQPFFRHRRARSMPVDALEGSMARRHDPGLLPGRPPAQAVFFNEYNASIATEYLVFVSTRASRAPPVECMLVVDRERLHHKVPRGLAPAQKPDAKKGSFMLLKKFSRHLQLAESHHSEPMVFEERCVHDIQVISFEAQEQQRTFAITYRAMPGGTEKPSQVELIYQAQTPTECAEIVARLHFLMVLVAK